MNKQIYKNSFAISSIGLIILPILLILGVAASKSVAQESESPEAKVSEKMPSIGDIIDVVNKASAGKDEKDSESWSAPVRLAVVFTLLALLPSLLVMVTSFTRIVIVLSFVRRALSTQGIPPTIAIIGLAVFLTIFTMAPTFRKMNEDGVKPYLDDKITFQEAAKRGQEPLKNFMLQQTRESDLAMFINISDIAKPETVEELPMYVVIPSFAISEFRIAFEMGCLLFIPFLMIDLVISGILLSTGMMMLPPVIISLPFKIMLFVLVDGWRLVVENVVTSFG